MKKVGFSWLMHVLDRNERALFRSFDSEEILQLIPVFRFRINYKFKASLAGTKTNKPISLPPGGIFTGIQRINQWYRLKREITRHKKSVEDQEVFLFSRSTDHVDFADDKLFNRLIDPFFIWLEERKYKTVKFEFGVTEQNQRAVKANQFPLDVINKYVFLSTKQNRKIKELDSAVSCLTRNTGIIIYPEEIEHSMKLINAYCDFFIALLKNTKVKVAFYSCYYTYETFGLNAACKKLGIKTVDIQHGKQGRYHPMNTNWCSIPDKGYKYLPDFFWNWGEESVQNILQWMPDNSPHIPLKGGNLWLSMWKNGRLGENQEVKYIQASKSFKAIILVTLQPIEQGGLPEFLIDTIRQLGKEYLWLMRLHPHMGINNLPALKKLTTENSNVEYENASRDPLYAILKGIDLHITNWSSVAYEALAFDVPTILIHEYGSELFKDEIEAGRFTAALNSEELKDKIHHFKHSDTGNYIETDLKFAGSAFSSILS